MSWSGLSRHNYGAATADAADTAEAAGTPDPPAMFGAATCGLTDIAVLLIEIGYHRGEKAPKMGSSLVFSTKYIFIPISPAVAEPIRKLVSIKQS